MPMTEEEIIQRARLAFVEVTQIYRAEEVLEGKWDDLLALRVAIHALRNLDKPLPVDPDEEELREIAKALMGHIDYCLMQNALPTYKAIKAKWGARASIEEQR